MWEVDRSVWTDMKNNAYTFTKLKISSHWQWKVKKCFKSGNNMKFMLLGHTKSSISKDKWGHRTNMEINTLFML